MKNSNSVQVKIDYKLKTLELFMSSNSRQYYIMLSSIPQKDGDLIISRDEPPIMNPDMLPHVNQSQ